MIITCGNRRLVSDRFGWTIQQVHVPAKGRYAGEDVWLEDRPAYPATLERGLEMLLERIIKEAPDTDIEGLAETVRVARNKLLESLQTVRELDV